MKKNKSEKKQTKRTGKTSKPEAKSIKHLVIDGKYYLTHGFDVKNRYIKNKEATPRDQEAFDEFIGEGVRGLILGFDTENRCTLRQGAGLYDDALELAMDYVKTFAAPMVKLEILYRQAGGESERKKIVNRFLSAMGLLRFAKGKKPIFAPQKVRLLYKRTIAKLSRDWHKKNNWPDGELVAIIAGNVGQLRFTGSDPKKREADIKKRLFPIALGIRREAVKITTRYFQFQSNDACSRYLRGTCKLENIPNFRP